MESGAGQYKSTLRTHAGWVRGGAGGGGGVQRAGADERREVMEILSMVHFITFL